MVANEIEWLEKIEAQLKGYGNIAVFKRFAVNDYEKDNDTELVGREDKDGIWLIMKIITTNDNMNMTYATHQNNDSVNSYEDAWNDRDNLTYGKYSEAF